jgi:hypothetical protein
MLTKRVKGQQRGQNAFLVIVGLMYAFCLVVLRVWQGNQG